METAFIVFESIKHLILEYNTVKQRDEFSIAEWVGVFSRYGGGRAFLRTYECGSFGSGFNDKNVVDSIKHTDDADGGKGIACAYGVSDFNLWSRGETYASPIK